MNSTKRCSKCQEEKPATFEFFFRDKQVKCGFRSVCKECDKKRNKRYYNENQEDILEQKKQYRQENLEELREKDRIYSQNNKERKAEYSRQWRKDNPEYDSQKYHKNKLKRQKQNKEWSQNNKDKVRALAAKKRFNKKNQTPEYANFELIRLIYKNCPEGYEVDHMIPLATGGLHYESNLCYLPASINSSKKAKSIEEFGLEVFNRNVIYWQDVLTG